MGKVTELPLKKGYLSCFLVLHENWLSCRSIDMIINCCYSAVIEISIKFNCSFCITIDVRLGHLMEVDVREE